jgi:hypothetical protein
MSQQVTTVQDIDDKAIDAIVGFILPYARTILKAPMIALMSALAVGIFSGAPGKAVIVGMLCLVAAFFTTWRRFLEPLSFWAFVAAVIYWCDAKLINRLATVASHALS